MSVPPTFRGFLLTLSLAGLAAAWANPSCANPAPEPIPLSEIGARATAGYQGEALTLRPAGDRVELHTAFQKLAGSVGRDGLRLHSTSEKSGRLQLRSIGVGRERGELQSLAPEGTVALSDKLVTFRRPGMTEEFSVSVDGVRQDFVVTRPPAGEGELSVYLQLQGARAESAEYGARLVLEESGRALAYSRLCVTDARGRVLPARLEVTSGDRLAVRVSDGGAAYPVRIDPTFSDADWVSLNASIPGVSGQVNAVASDGAGSIYVGGSFSVAGNVAASNLARWNGSAWSAVGGGVNNTVHALHFTGGSLYVGGTFTSAGGSPINRIARWNGSAWSGLGVGVDAIVRAIHSIGTDIYVGGDFNNAGGAPAAKIARWNGTSFSPLNAGVTLGSGVYALASIGTVLYVGGDIIFMDGVRTNFVCNWNGSAWSRMGPGSGTPGSTNVGVANTVFALAVIGTDLYIGGGFGSASGGVTASRIARWNGTAFSALSTGVDASVTSLAVNAGLLYVGGGFTTAGGGPATCAAVWNGTSWSNLGPGIENTLVAQDSFIFAMTFSSGVLVAGGNFRRAGSSAVTNLATWNGSVWAPFTSAGVSYTVNATLVVGTDLYIGGIFSNAGNVAANRIARWNGSAWSALGTGLNGPVLALASNGTDVYAGGTFTTAGGVGANRVARWNGSAWSALGSGANNSVLTLAANGTDLYAGGTFTAAGGVANTNRIARWNGTAWTALATGINGDVKSLLFAGGNLYAGGSFSGAGAVSASNIARWNGTAWSALGAGLGTNVLALAMLGPDLYAVGQFIFAGGNSANRIARWDGSNWFPLGSGADNDINAIAVHGSDIYVGGLFSTVGGVTASRVAKWNGTNWAALGSGADGPVLALATDTNNHLYLGGQFALVGATTASPFVAQANLPPAAPDIEVSQASALADGGTVGFGLVNAGQNKVLTFTVTNSGTAPLTGLAVNKDGVDQAEFTVGSLSATSIPVGSGSATFTVTFAPGSTPGPRSAAIHITSNVVGAKNPFDINLTASGGTAPSFLSPATAIFTIGSPGSFFVQASATPAPTLSLTGGTLPSGLSFTPGTGEIAGTPGAGTGGTHPLQFTASNGAPPNAVQSFSLIVNRLPVAVNDTLDTLRNTPVTLTASRLLLNDSDPDSDPLQLQSVAATSAAGGSIALGGGMLTYTPPVGYSGSDSFGYTINDGRGGVASATVLVTVAATGSAMQNLVGMTVEPGGVHIQWQGIVGLDYRIEYTDDLGANWLAFPGLVTANTTGVIAFTDTTQPTPTQRFYRTVAQP